MLQQVSEGSSRRLRGRLIVSVCLVGAAMIAPWSIVRAQHPSSKAPGRAAPVSGLLAGSEAVLSHPADADIAASVRKVDVSKSGPRHTIAAKGSDVAVKPAPVLSQAKKIAPHGAKSTGDSTTKDARSSSIGTGAPGLPNPASGSGHSQPAATGTDMKNRHAETPVQTIIFELKHVQEATIVKTLSSLFEGQIGKTMTILGDERTNSLIVRANTEQIREISTVLDQLDSNNVRDPESTTAVRIIPLKFAQAADLAKTLTTLFGDKPGKPVKILADVRTNSLVIEADGNKTDEIVRILGQLDIDKQR